MKISLSFLLLTLSFCLPVQAEEVTIRSSAKIYKEGLDHAKEQALNNVLLEALKLTVANMLDAKAINNNYEVIKNQIYRFKEKYILDFKVLGEEQIFDKNLYEIIIVANVDDEKIRHKLETLRIVQQVMKQKRLLVLYHNQAPEAVTLENEALTATITAVQKKFSEQSFLTFSELNMKLINQSLQEEIIGNPVDSLISLALNYNADVLVIMSMNSNRMREKQGTFFKVSATVNFNVFDTASGQQISATNVAAHEISVQKPNDQTRSVLLAIAGKHAGQENVRLSTEHITSFYKNTGDFGQVYSIIFEGYSPRRESLIIDYLETSDGFRNLNELKNNFGFLEMELLALQRKSILRRKITSELLEQKIEVATKSIPGNNLFFINPNPMEEEEEQGD